MLTIYQITGKKKLNILICIFLSDKILSNSYQKNFSKVLKNITMHSYRRSANVQGYNTQGSIFCYTKTLAFLIKLLRA